MSNGTKSLTLNNSLLKIFVRCPKRRNYFTTENFQREISNGKVFTNYGMSYTYLVTGIHMYICIHIKIKTHGHVSAAKNCVVHKCVICRNCKLSTPHKSITTGPILIKFTYFYAFDYANLYANFERNRPSSSQDMWKIAPFSSPFSSLHRFAKVTLSQPKTPFSYINFLQIWHTFKALYDQS